MFIMPQQTRRSPRVYRRNADINMTNLMDVMMVLLVVFMVAAPSCRLYGGSAKITSTELSAIFFMVSTQSALIIVFNIVSKL